METLEFAVELRKTVEKDNVMENSYAMFQIREASVVRRCSSKQVFLKFSQISQEKSCVGVAGLKRSATLLKRDSSTGIFL